MKKQKIDRRFLEVESKRFEMALEEDALTMIERGKGRPRRIVFPPQLIPRISSFVAKACDGHPQHEL